MQLKHIGIAAMVAAGTLMAASALIATGVLVAGNPSEATTRIEVFSAAVHDSRTDVDADRNSRFDPYTQGHRTGRFDPYTEGMGHPVVDLVWIERNT
jgi:hypothetical protein